MDFYQSRGSDRKWSVAGLCEVGPSPREFLLIWMLEASLMTLEPEMAISRIGQLWHCLDQCELVIHMAEMVQEEQALGAGSHETGIYIVISF